MIPSLKNKTDLFSHEHIGKIGKNCKINHTVQFFGDSDNFEIGDNVRIDAFCILSGKIKIGSHIHIAAGTYLFGSSGIILENYVSLSSRVSIYSVTDDYREGYLTNPTIPDEFKKVKGGLVILKKHVIVGAGSIIMPGIVLDEGASVGALTFVRKSVPSYTIISGNPAIVVGKRDAERLNSLEKKHKDILC